MIEHFGWRVGLIGMTRILFLSTACALAVCVVARPYAQAAAGHESHQHPANAGDPTQAMASEHLHADAHMKMTPVRQPQPNEIGRAHV